VKSAELAGLLAAIEKIAAGTMIRRGGRKKLPDMPIAEEAGKAIAGKVRHEAQRLSERAPGVHAWAMDEAKKRMHTLSHSLPAGKYHIPLHHMGKHVGNIVGSIVDKGKAIVNTLKEPHMNIHKGSKALKAMHHKQSSLQGQSFGDYEIRWDLIKVAVNLGDVALAGGAAGGVGGAVLGARRGARKAKEKGKSQTLGGMFGAAKGGAVGGALGTAAAPVAAMGAAKVLHDYKSKKKKPGASRLVSNTGATRVPPQSDGTGQAIRN
jgi:hypothetical protein